MPTKLVTDDSIPALAIKFPLAAALLSSWAHAGSDLGYYMGLDAQRISCARLALHRIPGAEG